MTQSERDDEGARLLLRYDEFGRILRTTDGQSVALAARRYGVSEQILKVLDNYKVVIHLLQEALITANSQ